MGVCRWALLAQMKISRLRAKAEDTEEGIIDTASTLFAVRKLPCSSQRTRVRYVSACRSTSTVDVAEVARRFQGGGHQRAAGSAMMACSNMP